MCHKSISLCSSLGGSGSSSGNFSVSKGAYSRGPGFNYSQGPNPEGTSFTNTGGAARRGGGGGGAWGKHTGLRVRTCAAWLCNVKTYTWLSKLLYSNLGITLYWLWWYQVIIVIKLAIFQLGCVLAWWLYFAWSGNMQGPGRVPSSGTAPRIWNHKHKSIHRQLNITCFHYTKPLVKAAPFSLILV